MPFDLPPYQQGSTNEIEPPEKVHPEVSKKCDDFMQAKIKEIATSPLPADERTAIVSLLKKDVIRIEHGSMSQVDKELVALDHQIKRYLRTPEGKIPHSPPTSTPELQEFGQKRVHEKQLDAKAEKLTGNYANILLGSINRLSLRQETKLLASKIVQDQVVNLRHSYRQGEITQAQFEAKIKALPSLLRPLAERMLKLEKLETKIDDVLNDITVSNSVRHMLASRVSKEIQAVKEQSFPNLESVDTLLEVVEQQYVLSQRVESFIANRYPDFFVYEMPILDLIRECSLEQKQIDLLINYYDTCMGGLIDRIADEKSTPASLEAYLVAVEQKITEYITKQNTSS